MVLLARSVLARLLARRGDPEASGVLDAALRDPVWVVDSYVAGPPAVAQVELGWLTGTLTHVPPSVEAALKLAADSRHTAIQAELCRYLRRAGHDVGAPTDAPGPWAPALAGLWHEAAAAWRTLGERYEQALELVRSGDDTARATGLDILGNLGASAALAWARRTS